MAEQKQETPVASFKITYFAAGGRAQALRVAASLGGLSFIDEFVDFPQWGQIKQAGGARWGGLPQVTVLDKDGKEVGVLGQSNTCLRFIGALSGLYPENPLLRALSDELLDSVEDVTIMLTPLMTAKDEDKKKELAAEINGPTKLPYWLGKIENRLNEAEKRGLKSGYFVTDTLTIGDLKVYYSLSFLLKVSLVESEKFLESLPKLKAFIEKLDNDDKLKKIADEFAERQKQFKEDPKKVLKVPGKDVFVSF